MFDSIKDAFNSSTDSETISPAEVAQDVTTLHEALDEFKLWSTRTVEWLELEQDRLAEEGDEEYANEVNDLIAYVQSVFFRIEYGDYAVRTTEVEETEDDPDEVNE